MVRAFAPASISNIGPAFDVLGLAIDAPGDFVNARRSAVPGLNFSLLNTGSPVPVSASQNVAAHVAQLMLDEFKPTFGIEMILDKQMPVGSGLGSSAASSVAAAVAVNALLPRKLNKRDLLRFVVEGERMASGASHADNVGPSLLGGLVLIRSYDPLDVVSIPCNARVIWVVVHPHVVVKTKDARRVLPRNIPLRDAVHQWGNVSGLTAGLVSGDIELIGKSIHDILVEPHRAKLIPGFAAVKKAALSSGALGCSISGSGPSIFAVATSVASARRIATRMASAFRTAAGISSDIYISRVNHTGARVERLRER